MVKVTDSPFLAPSWKPLATINRHEVPFDITWQFLARQKGQALNLRELSMTSVGCSAQAPGSNNHGQCANESIRTTQSCSMSKGILVVIFQAQYLNT